MPPALLLTIAGSDSGGGAGIQADLKTFAAHGAYGMSAVTAVTAQNTRRVAAIHELPPEVVTAQIDAVFEDIGVDAVKVGMVSGPRVARAVAAALRRWEPRHVVLDPVMVAESGDLLLEDEAVAILKEELLPLATVVTPNLPEAERLTGGALVTEAERAAAARRLARVAPAVLIKGGHGEGTEIVDLLFDGRRLHRFVHPRIETMSTHGTGCTLSSAIAARLARGEPLTRAVEGAVDYVHQAILAAPPIGGGRGPIDHLHGLRPVVEEPTGKER